MTKESFDEMNWTGKAIAPKKGFFGYYIVESPIIWSKKLYVIFFGFGKN